MFLINASYHVSRGGVLLTISALICVFKVIVIFVLSLKSILFKKALITFSLQNKSIYEFPSKPTSGGSGVFSPYS